MSPKRGRALEDVVAEACDDAPHAFQRTFDRLRQESERPVA